jgi:hypothetical protein
MTLEVGSVGSKWEMTLAVTVRAVLQGKSLARGDKKIGKDASSD